MEGNNDLNMSLFEDVDLELNIDSVPDELDEYTDDEDTPITDEEINNDDTSIVDDESDDNPSEDQDDPEVVAEEEDEDEGGDDDSPNLYSSLAQVLHEQGLLPSLNLQESEIKDVDSFSSAVRNEIDSNVKSRLVAALGEDGYEAVTSGVPLEQIVKHKETQQALDSINEEALTTDLELSKKVIYQDYLNQGIPEDRAKKLLRRVIAAGDEALIEDAKESLSSIRTFDKQRLQAEAQRNRELEAQRAKEADELEQNLKNTIYNSSELIKGLKLNKAIQDRVYNSITKNVGDGNQFETKLIQDRKKNPIEFDAKLYYLYEITNGFSDLSPLKKTTTSSATSDLEKAIRSSNKKYDNSNPIFTQDSDSYFGGGDMELVID